MRRFLLPSLIFFLSLLLVPVFSYAPNTRSTSNPAFGLEYADVIEAVDIDAIRDHVDFFAGLGTRATGYLGNYLAAEYIYDFFVNLSHTGVMENVTYQSFTVVDAFNHGANITITSTGDAIEAHPLLPNHVCTSITPPQGIQGPLVYAGGGYIKDFDHAAADVNGSIVLLDCYSRSQWINAAKLGAKAVIFLHPTILLPDLEGSMHTKRLVHVPLNFPRFYVDEDATRLLLEHLGEDVRLFSSQRWERLNGRNIMGMIRGTDYPNVYVALTSYYDSYSVAPSAAPGAQEALGVSALLELAKYLNQHPPKNSVIFIAFGGHAQGLAGSINFTYEHLSYIYPWGDQLDPEKTALGKKIYLNINLDFSTGSDTLAFYAESPMYPHVLGGGIYKCMGGVTAVKAYLEPTIKEVSQEKPLGRSYPEPLWDRFFQNRESMSHLDGRILSWKEFPYDSDPFMLNIILEFTITTALDSRPWWWTPFDTPDKLNYQNLQTQLELAYILISQMLLHPDLPYFETPLLREETVRNNLHYAMCWLRGTVAQWSIEEAWYEPVPNAIVIIECDQGGMDHSENRVGLPNAGVNYALRRFVTFTDEEGKWSVVPIKAHTMGWGYVVSAWVLNQTTGEIISAPDIGRHQYAPQHIGESEAFWPDRDIGYVVVFNCSTLVLFDNLRPTSLSPPTAGMGAFSSPVVAIYRDVTNVPVESWSEWSYLVNPPVTVLAVPSEYPVKVKWIFPPEIQPTGLLINVTEGKLEGLGYSLRPGEQLRLTWTNLEYAENMYWVSQERFGVVVKYQPSVLKSEAYQKHQRVALLLQEAREATARREYSKANSLAYEAWVLSLEVYSELRGQIEGAAYAVPVFAIFFIPFVFLVEKFLFDWRGKKRIVPYVGLFASLLAAFYLLHPGFSLAVSPPMVIIGFSTLLLCIPILYIVLRYVMDLIKELRFERLGRHEAEVSRTGEVGRAFLIGIEHMRRAKLRSALTLISILIMVSSLVNVTSMSAIVVPAAQRVSGTPPYQGLYIHRLLWGEGSYSLGDELVDLIRVRYEDEASVAPRAWRYASYPSVPDEAWMMGFRVSHGDHVIQAPVLWGLTPQDEVLKAFLIEGWWFTGYDRKAIILNEEQAEDLGINASQVNLAPVPVSFLEDTFHVIGIVGSDLEMLNELDGAKVTPIKFDVEDNPWTIHTMMDECLILPYETVISLGGAPASVSLIFTDPSRVHQAAEEVSGLLPDLYVYSCEEVKGELMALLHSRTLVRSVFGFELQVVPMAIVVLAVFNIMLGSVYERRRHIAIYAAVGLSPLHVSFMFLAEAMVYALMGGVVGYILALIQGKLAGVLLPAALALDYSSTMAFMALGIPMLTTILSSLYPSWLAARQVTPSLERVWKIPTKPKESFWEVPFPFTYADEKEVDGVLIYLQEYLNAHASTDAPDFYASNLKLASGEIKGKSYKGVTARLHLFPYDVGVVQSFDFLTTQVERERWSCSVTLERIQGPVRQWTRLNHRYLDLLRKQLLLWGSLEEQDKQKYMRTHRTTEGNRGNKSEFKEKS